MLLMRRALNSPVADGMQPGGRTEQTLQTQGQNEQLAACDSSSWTHCCGTRLAMGRFVHWNVLEDGLCDAPAAVRAMSCKLQLKRLR
jgi:hypothetical protein